MKQVEIDRSALVSARKLSGPTSSIKLLQVSEHKFAVEHTGKVFGFRSAALASYFEENEGIEVYEIKLVEISTLIGPSIETALELHLIVDTEEKLVLSQSDKLVKTETLYDPIPRMADLYSPFKVWGIPPVGNFARMLLTGRLVDHLECLNENGHFLPLLHMLWKEYEIASHESPHPDDRLVIEGEFMVFSAKAFNGVLVIFDYA